MRFREPPSTSMIRRGVGFAALGRGFYTWDLEPRSVVEMACELAGGAPRLRPTLPLRKRARRSRDGAR